MERNLAIEYCLQNASAPAYVIFDSQINQNIDILRSVKERTGCRILLALKAFATWKLFTLLQDTLDGVCASGLYEARLGAEEFSGGQVHVFSPAYSTNDMREIPRYANHMSFNSAAQWEQFQKIHPELIHHPDYRFGLRINPEHSESPAEKYSPCARASRLGILSRDMKRIALDGISGLHFHTLCEQDADALQRTLDHVEAKFGEVLHNMQWLNIGGGHLITRPGYQLDLLCELIHHIQRTYNLEIIMEPGEAVVLNAGILIAEVLDVVHNDMEIAILNTSASCHMPDVIIMPYRPEIYGAGAPGEKPYTYRLAGNTCLAGDVIGDYSFDEPLQCGSRIALMDMAHYTIVKNTMFNGIPLPAIIGCRDTHELHAIKEFGYAHFKERLS